MHWNIIIWIPGALPPSEQGLPSSWQILIQYVLIFVLMGGCWYSLVTTCLLFWKMTRIYGI